MNAQGWDAQDIPTQTASQETSWWVKRAEAPPGCQLSSCSLSPSFISLDPLLPGLLLQSPKYLEPATAMRGVDALITTSVPGPGLPYTCNQAQAKGVKIPITYMFCLHFGSRCTAQRWAARQLWDFSLWRMSARSRSTLEPGSHFITQETLDLTGSHVLKR